MVIHLLQSLNPGDSVAVITERTSFAAEFRSIQKSPLTAGIFEMKSGARFLITPGELSSGWYRLEKSDR